jgi:hypothetical protein
MNTILKIFDNIGFKFSIENNSFCQKETLNSFNKLDQTHVGYYIPYLARCGSDNLWEVGVGYVKTNNTGDVIVERNQIVSSSNKNNNVNFSNKSVCEFYLFANQANFNTGFSNSIVIDKSIVAYNQNAIYLIDSSNQSIDLILPENPLNNLSIEIKLVNGTNGVLVREHNGHIITALNETNTYGKLTYSDQWYLLSQPENNFKTSSLDSPLFSTLSNSNGDPYSFQYNDGSNGFAGSTMYWSSGTSNKLLLGSDSESLAHTIVPTSGSGSVIFNNDNQNSDFIVYGSGVKNNIFFTYDGKLGINIPSGTRPTTIFHVVNTVCSESMRLENRSTCHPTSMTFYHKPPTGTLVNNSIISQINLSASNSVNVDKDYIKIKGYAKDITSTSEKGHLDLIVKSGSIDINAFSADPESILVGYSGNNNLRINNNGYATIGYSNSLVGINSSNVAVSSTTVTVNSTSTNINSNTIIMGSGGSSITAQGTASIGTIVSSNLRIPSISPSSILSIAEIDGNRVVIATSGVKTNNIGTLNFSTIPSGKLLTTTTSGAVTGIYNLNDYFYTDSDIIWNKYAKRNATICLRQVTLDETTPLVEFSVGDQIAIQSEGQTTQYRFIEEITVNSSNITEIFLDQNVTSVSTSNFKIYSITKGGYLSITRYVEPGAVGDNSDIVLSIRPGVSTEFNTERKNIDFVVYGSEPEPALYIKAHTDQPIIQSGYYHLFATRDNNIFPMIITSDIGQGLNNQYSSANFGADKVPNLFSGLLSDVGTNGQSSYYGTYDQNGNVSEWVEKPDLIEMVDVQEIVAGGSIRTSGLVTSDDVAPTGLRSIELLDRSGCYDYVGFRIASLYNTTDSNNISASTGLNMDFISVTDPGNIYDSNVLYLKTEEQYSPITMSDIGSVDPFYRIGQYEITNTQYIKFLNAVAKVDDRNLYDPRMQSDDTGGVIRTGSSPTYDYTIKTNMDNKPVNFVSFISSIRFINWMHNGANWVIEEEDVDRTIDIGAYNIIPNGTNNYIIAKNRYRKYWLPNLDEWHKAAYFEPLALPSTSGVSAMMVRRSDPYVVTSGVSGSLFASVSVSGWLYVDRLIVGDNSAASSPLPKRPITDPTDPSLACTTSADCEFCEVCSDSGFCTASTDICCVDNCCKNWNAATEICIECGGCPNAGSGGTGGGVTPEPGTGDIPCPPFC